MGVRKILQKKFFAKNFFPVWTCIKPNLVSKIFPFTLGVGGPSENFFFQSEHVSSQIWCQKFFPLLWGVGWGGSLCEISFFQSEHVSSQIWCQKFFPLLGGGPSENFFSSLNMYQAKSGVKNVSLYRGGGESLCEIFFFQSEHVSSQTAWLKIFHFTPCVYLAYLRSYSHLNIVKYIGMY